MITKFLPMFPVLILLCLEFSVPFVSGQMMCIEREREALLTLKQGLIDDDGILSSWGTEGYRRDCCSWKGVGCNNATGNVIGLQLYGNDYRQLRGSINPALLQLHHLNNLDLSSNDFGGHPVPEFIGSMKTLRHLSLRKSNFSGPVPREFGNLTNLRTLDLSYNSLTFENLNWLSHLSLLSRLTLSGSNISDARWPQHILNLPSLQELLLQSCWITQVTSSPEVLFNSSKSLSMLQLSNSSFTSSIFSWLFNASTSLVSLDLSQNKLDGSIPYELGKLRFLEYLDLSNNNLVNGIPKSFGNLSRLQSLQLAKNKFDDPLAEMLGSLCCKLVASLETLDLSLNQITGPVPDLRSFLALKELNLQYNRLTGSLPLSIGELSTLEVLDVSYNFLEGTISESNFLKANNLKVLGLSFNALTMNITPDWIPPFQLDKIHLGCCAMGPRFPAWLRTQKSFMSVDLSCAGISEQVPKWFWDLSPALTYLNLSINNIGGEISDLSSKFHESSLIDISHNKFSGPLPEFHPNSIIIQMSHNMFHGPVSSICLILPGALLMLDLSHNQLSGELPDCWENMAGLFTLDLGYNYLSGEIPPSFTSLSQLQTLILRRNNFSGELRPALGNWQNLRILDLGENQLTGEFPAWIGMYCPDMMILSIQQNKFHSSIPSELCRLSKIQILDLSRNSISGKIPWCFNNFSFLAENNGINQTSVSVLLYQRLYNTVDLYIANVKVQWKGKEFEYNKTLRLLKLMDLSCNRLVGGIPRELYSLKGLISLNLSRNSLTGKIGPDIGGMERLESLDLSRNQLFGVIPSGLARLNYLQVLDLAYNNLSGKIPTGTQLQSFNASVFAGNSQLCGSPLALCLNDSLRPPINNQEHQDTHGMSTGFLSLSLMQGLGISMAFGFIFGFWVLIGSLLVKKSWRFAYFNFFNDVEVWMHTKTSMFLANIKQK